MSRVKGGPATRQRRKRVLKLAKGYYGAKSKKYRVAKQAVMKSGNTPIAIGRRRRRFSSAVDYQNQCCRSYERHVLQHVHLWFEEKRRRSEPQGPC